MVQRGCWILWIFALAGLCPAQEVPQKIRLAVVEFQEIGEAKRGAGETLAVLVTGQIDPAKFEVVERARIRKLLAEKMFASGLKLEGEEMLAFMEAAQADALLVGEVSDLYQSFSASYRVVYLDATVSGLKGSIAHCESWGLLKEKLLFSLVENGLGVRAAEPPAGSGWHGEKLPVGMTCAGEAGRYLWSGDGSEMVYVPAGPWGEGELGAYYIDRLEVTWAQYLDFCRSTGHEHPEKSSWSRNLDHPAVFVSWADAHSYCRWAGKSLPGEDQWEKAARGADGRLYPWGERGKEPLPACYGRKEGTLPVGSFPAGASFYGCLDMAGNAAEWCEEWYDPLQIEKVLRGGAWLSQASAITTTVRRRQRPAFRLDFTGFRTVVNAEK